MYRKNVSLHRVFLFSDPDWFVSASGMDTSSCGLSYSTACSTLRQVMTNSAPIAEGQFLLSVGTDTDIDITVPEVSEPVLINC